MNKQSGFKTFAGLGAGLLLLGAAALAQAAITITSIVKADGVTCTGGTVTLNETGNVISVLPDEATCSDPQPGSFTLTVTGDGGTGSGTITSSPIGINCKTTCAASFAEGATVTLTASEDQGSTFGSWTGCDSTSANTCTLTMTAAKAVQATFTADPPPPSACGDLPAGVTVVPTGSITSTWPQTRHNPLPKTITAFEFTVPAGGFDQKSVFQAIKSSNASRSKLLLVSACPGVLVPVAPTGCQYYQTENTQVTITANPAASDSNSYCKVEAGKTYYVNAVSKTNLASSLYSCSTTTNCEFYSKRSPPVDF